MGCCFVRVSPLIRGFTVLQLNGLPLKVVLLLLCPENLGMNQIIGDLRWNCPIENFAEFFCIQ